MLHIALIQSALIKAKLIKIDKHVISTFERLKSDETNRGAYLEALSVLEPGHSLSSSGDLPEATTADEMVNRALIERHTSKA